MKVYKIIGLLFITAISLTFCAMKQELQTEFPQEIQSAFYQKMKDGTDSGGTHFYIEFKKPFAANIKLKKIYFHNQESSVEEITKNTFVAHFYQINKKEDLILDIDPAKEYGNKAPVIQKSKFDLKRNEAVLEYKKDNKTQFFKITNLIEKPLR
ncbi:hypothetical protein QLS91_05100 [Flavobacterium sp. LB2P84]|jgi:hypothetical protein|uniref:Lipoprotein n=1 Tax=Flavobacterium yafengii TaxID=3041253 RepID=A0AAW6TJ88_9FLAO|nr:hypothetical protein [Flavobacterium yafengii]MDI5948504.1 hypothetical protein [Flavobacterium yafengii]MDI6032444.1 hypothetical protein [Flavobacterium yafengii]